MQSHDSFDAFGLSKVGEFFGLGGIDAQGPFDKDVLAGPKGGLGEHVMFADTYGNDDEIDFRVLGQVFGASVALMLGPRLWWAMDALADAIVELQRATSS